jgi:hypothetical protein
MTVIHIETLGQPLRYNRTQITEAMRIAQHLNRGKLVLCTRPLGPNLLDKGEGGG